MKKTGILVLLLIIATSFQSVTGDFVGVIKIKHKYKDLEGKDITSRLAPYLGKEWEYSIDDKNYKSVNEAGNWVQLYNGESNVYYSFTKEKKASKYDAGATSSSKFEVTYLDRKEKVAGYICDVMKVETDDQTTIYYYSKEIRTNPENFANHQFGNWNKYLKAADGGITLKFELTDHKNKFMWIATATEVKPMALSATDFEFPSGYTIAE
ncbi:MAG: DUF4412 domain-containing protein [Flavipsychrobacter sp.]|nr:DUF4412 domain-containing protein [Flavipsychrobacter sp.]